MKRPKIESEAVLAEAVVTWLRADGWRTFHEVDLRTGGRADIVAVRAGLVWIVETKLRAGLEVLAQALDRRRAGAHGVLVAVPASDAAHMLAVIAGRLGVGVIAVEELSDYDPARNALVTSLQPSIKAWPDFARKAHTAGLLAQCLPGHELQAAGVTGRAKLWTPFKAAARAVIYGLAAAPGRRILLAELALGEAVREYKRGFAAPQIRRWLVWAVDAALVPGCRLVGRGKDRAVELDLAAVTAEHRIDFQLDALPMNTAAARPS